MRFILWLLSHKSRKTRPRCGLVFYVQIMPMAIFMKKEIDLTFKKCEKLPRISELPDSFTVRIDIPKLKSINKLMRLYFTPNRVTAILGANCAGKSTILHALASAYQPKKSGEDHKFSEFFRPNPDATWTGSSCRIYSKYPRGKNEYILKAENFTKEDRWYPRHNRKSHRDVYYIGIYTTLPLLEYIRFLKNRNSNNGTTFNYNKTEKTDKEHKNILANASYILNRPYDKIFKISAPNLDDFFGVSHKGSNYSQLSMGAGEQRLLRILSAIEFATKDSLILIDEIDLLLHDDALDRLIRLITNYANDKERKLQVIFTTHRDIVLKKKYEINVKYLMALDGETKVLEKPTPDLIESITGECPKLINIYVEDRFSEELASRVARELGIFRKVSFVHYGPARNAFVMAGAASIKKQSNSIFVLDGDEYALDDQKNKQISSIVTGSDPKMKDARTDALKKIAQYNIPLGKSPEQHIHETIVGLEKAHIPAELLEYYKSLKSIAAVLNKHDYIDSAVEKFQNDESYTISKIIELFSKNKSAYNDFVSAFKEQLTKLAISTGAL